MHMDSVTDRIAAKGLAPVQCRVCQHRGFRSLEGVYVLFGGRHEYACGYGPSTAFLTILFSETVLSLFLDENLSPTESALHVAQWALLRGQVVGRVNMVPNSDPFSSCYGYFCREYGAHSPHPAESQHTRECVMSFLRDDDVHGCARKHDSPEYDDAMLAPFRKAAVGR